LIAGRGVVFLHLFGMGPRAKDRVLIRRSSIEGSRESISEAGETGIEGKPVKGQGLKRRRRLYQRAIPKDMSEREIECVLKVLGAKNYVYHSARVVEKGATSRYPHLRKEENVNLKGGAMNLTTPYSLNDSSNNREPTWKGEPIEKEERHAAKGTAT